MTTQAVLNMIKEKDVKMVDLRFTDLFGLWQHCAYPVGVVDERFIEEGLSFDGSSVRGWKSIEASDMLIKPDTTTAFIDPFISVTTLVMFCDILDPITNEPYSRDPRNIAKKGIEYLKSTNIADTAFFGPEPEFFIFDNVQYKVDMNSSFYHVDSTEGCWTTGDDEGPNLGYKIKNKGGYFPCAPHDSLVDIRNEMALKMIELGITVEAHHHEVATGGQVEIDVLYDNLLTQADKIIQYKYVVRNVARKYGKTVTFMPKPMFGDNGSGMHCHQSLWKDGKPLFAGDEYAGLSENALYYIGGILKHARAIAAFTNSTTNSYKRLVPGYEAPVNLAYSARNRSASIRIPMSGANPKAKRIEVRFPDALSNPYLAFTVLMMAGLDGIQNKIDPGEPMDKNLYDLDPVELASIPQMPGSLTEAIDALEKDHEFLLKGDVFTEDMISTWIEWKRAEAKELTLHPHPFEYQMYFND